MPLLKKLLPIFISSLLLSYIIYNTAPPISWQQATTTQILSFFIPFIAFLTSLANLFFQFLPKSFIFSLGVVILIVLKSLGGLNPINFVITVIIFSLIIKFFKGPKTRGRGGKSPIGLTKNLSRNLGKGLTNSLKIPKLRLWRKQRASSWGTIKATKVLNI